MRFMCFLCNSTHIPCRMCLHQFKYTGKRQIAGKTGGKPGTVKAVTLPARMQPLDFSGDSLVHSGSSSVGRDGMQHIGTLDRLCRGLAWRVAGLSLQWPWFDPRPVCVRFVAEQVALLVTVSHTAWCWMWLFMAEMENENNFSYHQLFWDLKTRQ